MPNPTNADELITSSYTIPTDIKDRIDQMAKDQDLNASQVVRRIFREYFERLDAEEKQSKTRKPLPVAA